MRFASLSGTVVLYVYGNGTKRSSTRITTAVITEPKCQSRAQSPQPGDSHAQSQVSMSPSSPASGAKSRTAGSQSSGAERTTGWSNHHEAITTHCTWCFANVSSIVAGVSSEPQRTMVILSAGTSVNTPIEHVPRLQTNVHPAICRGAANRKGARSTASPGVQVRATIQAACRALLRRNQHPVPGPEQLFRDLPQALRHPCDMVHGRHPRHHQNLPATATRLTPAGVRASARRPAAAGLAARIHRIVGRWLRCHCGDTSGDIDARRACFCVADHCRGARAAGPSADRCPVCSTPTAQRGTSRKATLERAPAPKGARACQEKQPIS